MDALSCSLLTLLIYAVSRQVHRRYRTILLSPIVIVPAVLLTLLWLQQTPIDTYTHDTHWMVWLLGPTTIAFAYPIYRQRNIIQRYPLTLAAGVVTGVTLGLASTWVLAQVFQLPDDISRSMLSRSVSSPFAMAAAGAFGGSPDLAVVWVLITGFIGMLAGESLLMWLNLRSSIVVGASLGAAAHAFGTAKAYEIGHEEGAVASLTMIFSGIALILIAPLVAGILA